MWTMIVIMTCFGQRCDNGGNFASIYSVPGFVSEAACNNAKDRLRDQDNHLYSVDLWTTCVNTKEK